MDREIEFRGYNYQYQKWFYGSLFIRGYDGNFMLSNYETSIIDEHSNKVVVDSSTVGQYTGLKDCNGAKIYDGDILREYSNDIEDWVVSYEYGKFVGTCDNVCEDLYELSDLEVIGNIYENILESKGE